MHQKQPFLVHVAPPPTADRGSNRADRGLTGFAGSLPDQDLINRIRTIFLHLRPHVSIAEGTVLLGWSRGEMSRAIAAGEVEVTSTSLGRWIWREELMAKAVELWPAEVIEEALGTEADAVLPDGVRLTDLHVRLPRHQVAMLVAFAERDRTT
jgi:hypothetical protein